MKKFEVEWSLSAHGTITIHAETREHAHAYFSNLDWNEFLNDATRMDFDSSATEVSK